MRLVATFFSLLIFAIGLSAQTSDAVLATANNQSFTAKDLASDARQAFETLPATIAGQRRQLLEQQIIDVLLDFEATAQKTTPEKLVEAEIKRKVKTPSTKEIQAVYDANRAAIGNRTLEEVRPQIVEFLQREPQRKVVADYTSNLKIKYKVALAKDVNAPDLMPFDVLATVGGKPISVESFEAKNKITLNDLEANVYEQTKDALQQIIYSNLVIVEAKAQNLNAGDFIAREITNKMRDFSTDEREKLESELRKRLFQKYNAKILLKEPQVVAQTISTAGSASKGNVNAPVVVVMFSDFQCSHCAATHPILQKVLAEYADKTRFIVRNFPLETIHENAFRAALAAAAANAQGKFFEYIELLYANQDSLDTASLKQFASKIGLDRKRFDADLDSEKYAAEVRKDIEDGKRYGINATPTIFVNGVKVHAFSAESFRDAIDKALKK